MNFSPIEDSNISHAWAHALLRVLAPGSYEISPFAVNLTGFDGALPEEDSDIRKALDKVLDHNGQQFVHTVANTIFPQSLWDRSSGNRHHFYKTYLENLPDYISMESRLNCRGLYFSRLTAYGIIPKTGEQEAHLPSESLAEDGNQLEYIISHCKKGARRAMFQATLFDPVRDVHDGPYQTFPCLQHITFVPNFKSNTISLNAFYATQQLFVKAYGNWLGLARLGAFVANQTNLKFDRLTCYVGILKLDKKPKQSDEFSHLRNLCSAVVNTNSQTTATSVN